MYGARTIGVRVQPPKREQKGQGCKQNGASPQRAMFSKLRGLAPPKQSSLSLSLSLFSRACIRVPLHVPLLFSYFLLGPFYLGMAMSVLHFLYLAGQYPWNIGNVWFIFSLNVIALCMMHVYIHTYIYICLLVYVWVIVHFV